MPEESWQPLQPLIEGHRRSKVKLGPKAEKCCSKKREDGRWRGGNWYPVIISCIFLCQVRGSGAFVCLFVFYTERDGCYLSNHPSRSAESSSEGNISCQELSKLTYGVFSTVRSASHPSLSLLPLWTLASAVNGTTGISPVDFSTSEELLLINSIFPVEQHSILLQTNKMPLIYSFY